MRMSNQWHFPQLAKLANNHFIFYHNIQKKKNRKKEEKMLDMVIYNP